MSTRVASALARARELVSRPWSPATGGQLRPARFVAVGDPQASCEQFFSILDHHDLLGDDGSLGPDVALVSVGDHFDYRSPDPAQAGHDGVALLRWLAAHPAGQVAIVLGNHDAARVMELVAETDDSFARARELGEHIDRLARRGDNREAARLRAEFAAQHPGIPTPAIARRDFSSYCEAQRDLIMQLLLGGRVTLAQVAQLATGEDVLVTHAGVTERELDRLGLPVGASADAIARALNDVLVDAVASVRPAWQRGQRVALALEPVHHMGVVGHEGGGLLYHRPANSDRPGADRAWELDANRPRRFDPRSLPSGLIQLCGHTSHHKCLRELEPWIDAAARDITQGMLRSLVVCDRGVSYRAGIIAPSPATAVLYMLEAEMAAVVPDEYAVFPLATTA